MDYNNNSINFNDENETIGDHIVLDFTNCNHWHKIHTVLKEAFDFPDYYGGNTDALWDCLTDMLGDSSYIELFGFEEVEKRYKSEWDSIIRIIKKTKHAYNDKYSNSFIVILVHEDGTREEIK